jgi:threonine/homoserine/homoserine lactone efflux protein
MGATVGQILVLAVAVSLSPIPIIGVVLMLGSARGRANGPAFVLGWIVGLTALGGVIVLAAGAFGGDDTASLAGGVQLALGVLLLVVAARKWRGRPRDGESVEMPKWLQSVDHFGPVKAAGLGVLLSAANPKNMLLIAAAAEAIGRSGDSATDQAAALAIFVAIATVGPLVPVALYFALGERSRRMLDGLRNWMTVNNLPVMIVLCLLIAAKLIGDGISALSA